MANETDDRPAVPMSECNACGAWHTDGCDHCCGACLGTETCPACGPLASKSK